MPPNVDSQTGPILAAQRPIMFLMFGRTPVFPAETSIFATPVGVGAFLLSVLLSGIASFTTDARTRDRPRGFSRAFLPVSGGVNSSKFCAFSTCRANTRPKEKPHLLNEQTSAKPQADPKKLAGQIYLVKLDVIQHAICPRDDVVAGFECRAFASSSDCAERGR